MKVSPELVRQHVPTGHRGWSVENAAPCDQLMRGGEIHRKVAR
jgi:hypothetical protein